MRNALRPIPLVIAAFLASSCGLVEPDGQPDELERQREQWRSQDIQHYSMEFRASCFCGAEFTDLVIVDVVDDSIQSVSVKETGLPVQFMPADAWLTVEELFDAVERALENDAHEIEVTYDADLGYPDFIFIDHEEMAIDDEVGYRVLALSVVQ
jgi:hypothetical protein